MLFVLDQPATLLGLALGFVVAVYLGTAAQSLVARALGDPMPIRSGGLKPTPRLRVSAFSAIAVVLTGWGWAEPVPMNDRWRARRFHVAAAVLVRPLVYALLCLATLAAVRVLDLLVGLRLDRGPEIQTSGGFAQDLLFAVAVSFAALCVVALIPVPPTDLGRVIFTLGGQSLGWQKARHQLEERNFGVGIVLALILLPVLFQGFPSWVGQLAPQLVIGLGNLLRQTVIT